MNNDVHFATLVSRIRNALGCGKDIATDYAKLIGDKPEIVGAKIQVRNEDNRVIAYVPASVLENSA